VVTGYFRPITVAVPRTPLYHYCGIIINNFGGSRNCWITGIPPVDVNKDGCMEIY